MERQVGAGLLLAQPAVIVAELVVAARWRGDYSHARNTISDLGAVNCGTIRAAYGPVEVCSPWHPLMNTTFVLIGIALALGALAVRGLGPSLARRPAMILLFVAGVSSAGVGLVPLDVDAGLHTLVATPLFVTQPLALLLVGSSLWRTRRAFAVVLLSAGTLAAGGGLAFAATLMTGDVGGLYERIALWPCHLGIAVIGLAVLRPRRVAPSPLREWSS